MKQAAQKKAAPAGVKERIMTVAIRLFRCQGYSETGINQIIEEAEVARASLYLHFPTKEKLGQAYLQSYADSQFALLAHLMRRYPEPAKFVAAWTRILKREARDVGLNGCAMANMRAQTPPDHADLKQSIHTTAVRTVEILQEYVKDCQKDGRLSKQLNAKQTARRLFAAYEGVMQTYQLTGELEAVDDFVVIAARVLGE